jgi:hypothetical protein
MTFLIHTNCVYYHVIYSAGCCGCVHHALQMYTKGSKIIRIFYKATTREISLVNFQLDRQNFFYLHIIHLLKSSTCFERYPAYVQEGYVVTLYMQPLVSSLSADDCPVHRLRESSFLTGAQNSLLCTGWERTNFFLTGAQDSHLQTVTIPEAAYIQLRRRPPEDERGNARNM